MKIHFFDKEIFSNEDGKIEFFPEICQLYMENQQRNN